MMNLTRAHAEHVAELPSRAERIRIDKHKLRRHQNVIVAADKLFCDSRT
jgi:hypothetical protein